MDSALAVLRGLRNGSYYGTKIRAPHAFVMSFLFRHGTMREKLRNVVRLTFEHSKGLAIYVAIYKVIIELLRHDHVSRHAHAVTTAGRPAQGWHAAVAGAIAGYFIWGKYSSVNYQITMYVMARVVVASFRLAAAKGIRPFAQIRFQDVYPAFAAGVWAAVMYLYETHASTLHPSLKHSMDFLYAESTHWSSLSDFTPSPATMLVLLLTYVHV